VIRELPKGIDGSGEEKLFMATQGRTNDLERLSITEFTVVQRKVYRESSSVLLLVHQEAISCSFLLPPVDSIS
jgi:hypothetical protein